MGVRCTIRLDELELMDAEFVAKYQKRSLNAYIANCVRMETQKRLKSLQKSIEEEIHATTLLDSSRRWGNESEGKSALSQLIREIINEELSGEAS